MYHGDHHAADVSAVMAELEAHGRRARLAHRALLALYASAAVQTAQTDRLPLTAY